MDLSLEQFAAAMDAQRWTFAKTYAAWCPHFYTVARWWQPLEGIGIKDCGRFIEEQGELLLWGRTVRRYATVNGFRYWQMDPHWSQCDLINRQELSLSTCKPVSGEQLSLFHPS